MKQPTLHEASHLCVKLTPEVVTVVRLYQARWSSTVRWSVFLYDDAEERTPLHYSTWLPVQSQLTDDMRYVGLWPIGKRNHKHAPEPYPRSNGMSCTMSGEREGANQTGRVIPGAVNTALGSAWITAQRVHGNSHPFIQSVGLLSGLLYIYVWIQSFVDHI